MGCSSKSDTVEFQVPESGPTEAVVEEEAVQEDPAEAESEQGLTDKEACALLQEAAMELADASLALLDDPESLNPQDTIDLQREYLEVIKDLGERAASDEFREKALKTYELGLIHMEFDQRIQVEKDTTVDLEEMKAVSDEHWAAYAELAEFCAPAQ